MGVQITPSDNPSVRRVYRAGFQGANDVRIEVPNNADVAQLIPSVEFEGTSIEMAGRPWVEGQPVDFTTLSSIGVRGKDEASRLYHVEVVLVPPLTLKNLFAIYAVPDNFTNRPLSEWARFYPTSNDELWEIDHYQQNYLPQLQSASLKFEYHGVGMAFDGQPVSGMLSGIDLRVSHTVTVTAEDLSTSDWVFRTQYASQIDGHILYGPEPSRSR